MSEWDSVGEKEKLQLGVERKKNETAGVREYKR
jgi:hypothetical protein